MAGLPIKLSDNPGSVRTAAPMLGEHTIEVLSEAGYSPDQVKHFLDRRIVGHPEAPASFRESLSQT
jgi:crotonobetainyl-CoA:carnitine CoA-transferase CaiB-like acyl-CoA transferase